MAAVLTETQRRAVLKLYRDDCTSLGCFPINFDDVWPLFDFCNRSYAVRALRQLPAGAVLKSRKCRCRRKAFLLNSSAFLTFCRNRKSQLGNAVHAYFVSLKGKDSDCVNALICLSVKLDQVLANIKAKVEAANEMATTDVVTQERSLLQQRYIEITEKQRTTWLELEIRSGIVRMI